MVSSEAALLRWGCRWLCPPVTFALCWPKYPFLKRIQVRSHFVAIMFTYLLPYRFYSKIQSPSETSELDHTNFQGTHPSPYHRVRLMGPEEKVGCPIKRHSSNMIGSCFRQRQESSMTIFNWLLSLFVRRKISPPWVQQRVRENQRKAARWTRQAPGPKTILSHDLLVAGRLLLMPAHAQQNVSWLCGLCAFASNSRTPEIWTRARTFLGDSSHELIINVLGSETGWAFIPITQGWW